MGAFQYGVDAGIFRRNGINVDGVSVFPTPPAALAALASGQVQFAYSPVIPIVNAYAISGVALRVIAPGNGLASRASLSEAKNDAAVAATLGNATLCANPASGVSSWASLAGKRIAVPARKQQAEVLISNAVKTSGSNPSTITWIEMPFAKVIPALQSGAIDAGFLDAAFTQQCDSSGLTSLGHPGVKFFSGSPVIGMWVTTAKFMDENPNVVKNFQKSLFIAHQSVMASKKTLAKAVAASTKITGATLANAKAGNSLYYPLIVTKADIENPVAKMIALGYLDSAIDTSGLLMRQYRP
jgi:NitT/TauT family transport system substrate-binding protein